MSLKLGWTIGDGKACETIPVEYRLGWNMYHFVWEGNHLSITYLG